MLLSDLLNQLKSTPKYFLDGDRLSQLFSLCYHKQTKSYLIDDSNQSIKLSKIQVISLLIPVFFLLREETDIQSAGWTLVINTLSRAHD